MRRHSDRVRRTAMSLYESGLSCREAARIVTVSLGKHVSPPTVAGWARREGIRHPVGGVRWVELPPEVRELYESGLRLDQIARRFHVGRTVTAKRLREMGTEIRPGGFNYGTVLTVDCLNEMCHKRGMRAQEIAKAAGCSTGTVYNWLRKRSIPLKRER